ncbi:inhibitor of growth protein 3-like [Anastrepha ludens]|uniref:inhibitor of growth protein 3-like n=1 Tax=Anastrepha ludens TaxID=28586 RepID=UPI0023B1E942|nr:inhibitor of growth protein 3-like [Anastrepha ludens]
MLPASSNVSAVKEADENEPSTSSFAAKCHSAPRQASSITDPLDIQNSNTSLYDNSVLTPPDLTSDEEEEFCFYNPNQPCYCICNKISYGRMIACNNRTCPYEWFHFPCVGIKRPPKGKWYCPLCTIKMQCGGKRKRKFS